MAFKMIWANWQARNILLVFGSANKNNNSNFLFVSNSKEKRPCACTLFAEGFLFWISFVENYLVIQGCYPNI